MTRPGAAAIGALAALLWHGLPAYARSPVYVLLYGGDRAVVRTFDNVNGVFSVAVGDAGFQQMVRDAGGSVRWSPGGTRIVVGSRDGRVCVLQMGSRTVSGDTAVTLPFSPYADVGTAFVPLDAVMRMLGLAVASESGSQVTLVASPPPAAQPPPAVQPAAADVYVVQPGDDLYRIAQAHGLSVAELARLNGLQGERVNTLMPGDCLVVSAAPNAGKGCPAPSPAPGGVAGGLAQDLAAQGGALTDWARRIVDEAVALIGAPYVWGGTSPLGFDCSGFVQYVFAHLGLALPRTADRQYDVGDPVSVAALAPGDLVFFQTYAPGPSHVGIYVGKGRFVSSTDQGVRVSRLTNPYWADRYLGARLLNGR